VRVLVTGGAGYIGSITVKLLLERGHQVVVLDTLEKGWREAVDPRADLVIGSVGDAESVTQALRDCDGVVHLAGYIEVAESQADPDRYFRNNSTAPLTLLEAMIEHDVKALVFSSTAAVYGEPESIPIMEDAPTRPLNAYGESKLRFERSIESFRARGLRATVLRYFNVAGAWRDGTLGEAHSPETHIVPRVLWAMREGQDRFDVFGGDYPTRDGTCVRDYMEVTTRPETVPVCATTYTWWTWRKHTCWRCSSSWAGREAASTTSGTGPATRTFRSCGCAPR